MKTQGTHELQFKTTVNRQTFRKGTECERKCAASDSSDKDKLFPKWLGHFPLSLQTGNPRTPQQGAQRICFRVWEGHHQDTAVLVSMCSTTDSTAQGRNGRNALLPGPQGAARNYPHPWQCRGIGPLPTRASLMRLLHNNGGKSQFPQHGASICIPKWALRPRRASASTKQSALCSPTHRIWGS